MLSAALNGGRDPTSSVLVSVLIAVALSLLSVVELAAELGASRELTASSAVAGVSAVDGLCPVAHSSRRICCNNGPYGMGNSQYTVYPP